MVVSCRSRTKQKITKNRLQPNKKNEIGREMDRKKRAGGGEKKEESSLRVYGGEICSARKTQQALGHSHGRELCRSSSAAWRCYPCIPSSVYYSLSSGTRNRLFTAINNFACRPARRQSGKQAGRQERKKKKAQCKDEEAASTKRIAVQRRAERRLRCRGTHRSKGKNGGRFHVVVV